MVAAWASAVASVMINRNVETIGVTVSVVFEGFICVGVRRPVIVILVYMLYVVAVVSPSVVGMLLSVVPFWSSIILVILSIVRLG